MREHISYVLILSVFLYASCGKPQSDEKDIGDATLSTTDSSVNSVNINDAVEKEQEDYTQFDYEDLSQEIKEAVPFEHLQVRQNLIYIPNTAVPYSGTAFYEEPENKQEIGLFIFEKGKPQSIVATYPNGQLWRLISLNSSNIIMPEIAAAFYEEPEEFFVDIAKAAAKSKDGPQIGWYQNGQLEYKQNYSGGVLDGLAKGWYQNGQLRYEENYSGGVLDGLAKGWYQNGQLNQTLQFTNGSLIEAEVFKINGVICEKTTLSSGNGKFAEYYPDKNGLYSLASYANGKKDGEQTTHFSDGVISSVESYLNGKKHGYRINYDKSKSNYKIPIYYEDDYPANGYVSIVSEDKQQTEKGLMVDGLRDGGWTLTNNKEILLKRESYELGILVGKFTSYFPTGEIHATGLMKNGEKHGFWSEYSENGESIFKGEYKGGLKDGDWILYNKENAPVSKATYKGDNKNYEIIYFENGEINEEGEYVQGKKDGLWRIKNTANKSFEVGKYQNGLRHGLWIEVKLNIINGAKNFESGKLVKIIENDQLSELYAYDEVSNLGRPRPIKYTTPTYPGEAKRNGLEGKVTAKFDIDQNGYTKNIKVIEATDSVFIKNTIEAIKEWKFTPPSRRVEAFGEEYVIDFKSENLYTYNQIINYNLPN